MKLFRLFRKQAKPETVAQNAARFVSVVDDLAHEKRMVVMYPHPGWRGHKSSEYDWPLMVNEKWRNLVHRLLIEERVPVKDATFQPPDSLDGWTFFAISTAPIPRLAQLELEDLA